MFFIKGFIILFMIFLFLIIIIWVYWPNNNGKIEDYAKIPFIDDRKK